MTIGLGDDFEFGVTCPAVPAEQSYWFIVRNGEVLLKRAGDRWVLPRGSNILLPGVTFGKVLFLGRLEGIDCCAVSTGENAPPGWEFVSLRTLHGQGDDRLFWVGGRAVQLVDWDLAHRYCGLCGQPTTRRMDEWARECEPCGRLSFPRLAPAVIVLIEKGDELLLSHSLNLAPGVYSLVAGFVEPGETLEQATVREVREEVGLEIKNLRYFGSQPWPFPHSLMVGFTADYAGGEIRVDPAEVSDAAWYRYDCMPPIPGSVSISRRLIDFYLAKHDRGLQR